MLVALANARRLHQTQPWQALLHLPSLLCQVPSIGSAPQISLPPWLPPQQARDLCAKPPSPTPTQEAAAAAAAANPATADGSPGPGPTTEDQGATGRPDGLVQQETSGPCEQQSQQVQQQQSQQVQQQQSGHGDAAAQQSDALRREQQKEQWKLLWEQKRPHNLVWWLVGVVKSNEQRTASCKQTVKQVMEYLRRPEVLQKLRPRQLSDLMWAAGNLQAEGCRGRYESLRWQCIETLDVVARFCATPIYRLRVHDNAAAGSSEGAAGQQGAWPPPVPVPLRRRPPQPNAWPTSPPLPLPPSSTPLLDPPSTLRFVPHVSLVSMLDGCSRAGYLPPPSFLEAMADALQRAADDVDEGCSRADHAPMKARLWAQAMRSAAVMRWPGAPTSRMAAAFLQQLGSDDPDGWAVANVAWALGTLTELRAAAQQQQQDDIQRPLDMPPSVQDRRLEVDLQRQEEQLWRQLLSEFSARLGSATPQAVANVLIGVARADARGADELLRPLLPPMLDALLARARDASAQAVSNTLWSLATLSSRGLDVGDAARGRMAGLLEVLGGKVRDTDVQIVSNTLWAVATLGDQGLGRRTIAQAWFQPLLDNLLAAPSHRAQAVASTMWALGKLAHSSPDVPDPTLVQRLQALLDLFLGDCLADANLQHVGNVAWALSSLRVRPTKAEAAALLSAALRLDDGGPRMLLAIGQLLTAFAELRLPLQRGEHPWRVSEVAALLAGMRAPMQQSLCNISHATAVSLSPYPEQLATAKPLVQELLAAAVKCAPPHFVVRSGGSGGGSGSSGVKPPVEKVMLCQLYHIHLMFWLLAGCEDVLPAQVLPACHAEWVQCRGEVADAHPTAFQANVFAAAQRLQDGPSPCLLPGSVQQGREALLGGGLFAVDIVAVAAADDRPRRVIIEADGPSHYACNESHFELGSTVVRNILLRALPPEPPFEEPAAVVCVSYLTWKDLLNDDTAKEEYLRGLLADQGIG